MFRIRKNDTVIVTTGKSKGVVGEVLSCRNGKVLVSGANKIKKHVKPNPNLNEQGGIKEMEAYLDVSNVAIYNNDTGKADKVGFKVIEVEGKPKKVRYFKSNNEIIERA